MTLRTQIERSAQRGRTGTVPVVDHAKPLPAVALAALVILALAVPPTALATAGAGLAAGVLVERHADER
jgi:hypothetical protein